MNSDQQRKSEAQKLWWESPLVMVATLAVISLLGVVDQMFN